MGIGFDLSPKDEISENQMIYGRFSKAIDNPSWKFSKP